MDLRLKATAVLLGAAICAVLAAPALGAPAGDEYLPKVPKASGNSSPQNQNPGSSAGSSSSGTGTTDTTETQAAVPAAGGGDSGKGNGKQPKSSAGANAPAPIAGAPASSTDDSSGSTLLSPIVILLIAGVLIAAVGMTLRRRNADGSDEADPVGSDPPGRGKTPPTPDGEIIAGGDKAS